MFEASCKAAYSQYALSTYSMATEDGIVLVDLVKALHFSDILISELVKARLETFCPFGFLKHGASLEL